MIIGNPYKFSIIAKVIKEWNPKDSNWGNGVLLFCIDGELFPKHIDTATLNSEIHPLKEKLINLVIDAKLWEMEKEKAFIEMYNITFPAWDPEWDNECDICNDYRYFISPETMAHFGCYVFAVSNGAEIRIMAAKLDYIIEDTRYNLNNIEISEAFITNDELNEIILKLDELLV